MGLDTSHRTFSDNLDNFVKKVLVAFCEINVSFSHRLDIYGSVHVRSDDSDVTCFILNEHCYKETPVIRDTCNNHESDKVFYKGELNDGDPFSLCLRLFDEKNEIAAKKTYLQNEQLNGIFNSFQFNHSKNDNDEKLAKKLCRRKGLNESPTCSGEGCGVDYRNFGTGRSYESDTEDEKSNGDFKNLLSYSSQSVFPEPTVLMDSNETVLNIKEEVDSAVSESPTVDAAVDESSSKDLMEKLKSSSKSSLSRRQTTEGSYSLDPPSGLERYRISDLPQIDHRLSGCLSFTDCDLKLNRSIPVDMSNINKVMAGFMSACFGNDCETPEGSQSQHACIHCMKAFPNQLQLQLHSQFEHQQGFFRDGSPDASFKDSIQYVLPSQTMSAGDREGNKLSCLVCSLTFRSLDGLKCHINSKHSRNKLYKCKFCSESFLTRQAAYTHRVKFHLLASKRS